LKWFSLTTATTALVFAPASLYFGKTGTPLIGKLVISGTIAVYGVTTTLLLHWLSRVYVHKMFFDPSSRTFVVETFNVLGMSRRSRFHVGEVDIPREESMFSTFTAAGRKYFLHTDMKEVDQILGYVREYNYERDVGVGVRKK